MRTKRQQKVSLSWYQSAAIYVGLQLSTLCGGATLSPCRRHNSWSLTLFSVNRWQVALVFFYGCKYGACFTVGRHPSAEEMYSIPSPSSSFSATCFGGNAFRWQEVVTGRTEPLCLLPPSLLSRPFSLPLLSSPLISLSISFIVTLRLSESVAIWCLISPFHSSPKSLWQP